MFALREMNMQGQALFEEQMLPGSKAGGLGLAEGRGHSGVSRCMVGHGAWALSASDSRGLVHASENFLEKTPTVETVWVFLGKAELIKKTAPPPPSLPSMVCASAHCSVPKVSGASQCLFSWGS